jgi:hypothetical protein
VLLLVSTCRKIADGWANSYFAGYGLQCYEAQSDPLVETASPDVLSFESLKPSLTD